MRQGKNKSIRPRAGKDEPRLRYNWMTPYIISHHNPFTLYCGANKLFKSVNRGDDWRCVSGDLTTSPPPEKQGDVPYGTITTISESPSKVGLLYVGTDDGNIHVTTDDGTSWTKISDDLPKKWVTRVAASMHDDRTVYATLTGYHEDDFSTYVFVSGDSGRTWKSIAANLPAESVNVIREDPDDADILYIGTDLGIYVSLDKGGRWQSLCSNLPTTSVHDIAIHQSERELVIGTHGRSAFVLDIKSISKNSKKEK